MMKTAELRNPNDAPDFRPLDGSRLRRIFGQRQVRPRLVVVRHERFHMPVQRSFPEHDHVVQTLSPDGANDPFHVRTLQWLAMASDVATIGNPW